MQQGDTISAIATPQGEGGIGVIRISGEHALKTADKVFRAKNGKPLVMAGSHRAVYGHIVDEAGKVIDEALALVMLAPHSYTVEDVVELQCHGGLMTLRKTLELTWKAGARPAERGEFTKRAFLNGRLDLSEAQAVMDIIQARTETSLTMAAGHLTGHFSKEIQSMRHDVLGMIAHIEAAIDFPEDEVDDILTYDIEKNVVEIRNKIANLLKTAHAGRILRDGLLTAIIGKPNVGKSSLLNSLLREERAIVTDVPGRRAIRLKNTPMSAASRCASLTRRASARRTMSSSASASRRRAPMSRRLRLSSRSSTPRARSTARTRRY